jgi:hypothetical protein
MCIDDWRLGRLIRSKITAASIAGAGTLTINPNMQRVGIQLSSASPSVVIGSFITVTIDGNLICYLFSSIPTVTYNFAEDGDIPTKQFILTNGNAVTATNVSIIEWFLPEEYIQAGIDSFKSQYKFGGL